LPGAIAADYGGVSGPDWYQGVAHRVIAHTDGGPWIAVLHSGAGAFAPVLAAASSDLVGAIFVDAVLPYPGRSYLSTAPPLQIEQLRRLTTDGLLAPWNKWFESDPVIRLVRDPDARDAFTRNLPRVPFAFLEAVAPDRSEWERIPAAYLQLSKVYDDTAARAEQRGWVVRRVRSHHLAMVTDPAMVADLLLDLASAIRSPR
jgi:pimeloyl-ACP methyl ester carboxylesterase